MQNNYKRGDKYVKQIMVTDRLAFLQVCGKLQNVELIETRLDNNSNSIYFVGSILDKSEIYYRKVMNIQTEYLMINAGIPLEELDLFWIANCKIIDLEEFKKNIHLL